MTTKQEIKNISKKRIPSVVEEQILPEMLDNLADWSGELVGKLATLSAEDEKQVNRAWEAIYTALVEEAVKQLKKHATPSRSKLPTKN